MWQPGANDPVEMITMAIRSAKIDELIRTIHSAALGAEGWTRIVDDLCKALSAEAASLVRPTHAANIKPFCQLVQREPNYVRDYLQHWAIHDCWYQGALRNRRIGVGMVNSDNQLIERREFQRSPFFNEYLRQFDIERMMNLCLAAPDPQSGHGPVALSFYRGVGKTSWTSDVSLGPSSAIFSDRCAAGCRGDHAAYRYRPQLEWHGDRSHRRAPGRSDRCRK
jgi:hypothetical protein